MNEIVGDDQRQLDAGVDLLEGLLVKKAGLNDAMGLIESVYPGRRGRWPARTCPESKEVTPTRIGEVYTQGTLTLARLGREAPIAAASPSGEVLRNIEGGSLAARRLYPDGRQERAGEPAALAGDRHRLARSVRAARRHRQAAQAPTHAAGLRRQVQTPAPFEYERATSVDGALAALARGGPEARIIAGGHSLLPMMKLRLANPEHLVDINEISELAYIDEGEARSESAR